MSNNFKSFISVLTEKVETCPDKIFCKEINGNSITFDELDKLSSVISRFLIQEYSIKKGEVVFIRKGSKHKITAIGDEMAIRLAVSREDVEHIYPDLSK
mgnify:CR=1 FL=1